MRTRIHFSLVLRFVHSLNRSLVQQRCCLFVPSLFTVVGQTLGIQVKYYHSHQVFLQRLAEIAKYWKHGGSPPTQSWVHESHHRGGVFLSGPPIFCPTGTRFRCLGIIVVVLVVFMVLVHEMMIGRSRASFHTLSSRRSFSFHLSARWPFA